MDSPIVIADDLLTPESTATPTTDHPVPVHQSRKARRRGKRIPKGTPYRSCMRNGIELQPGPVFKRVWFHSTKGEHKQTIPFKEAALLIASGAFTPRGFDLPPQPEAIAA